MSAFTRWLRHGGRARQDRPIPGDAIGWNKPPAAGDGTPPPRPLPGTTPGQPRPWMTADYYAEGYVIVRDHIARKQFRLNFPSGDDMAAEIKDLLP